MPWCYTSQAEQWGNCDCTSSDVSSAIVLQMSSTYWLYIVYIFCIHKSATNIFYTVALHSIHTRALTFENLRQMLLPLGRCVACRPGTATLWWADSECIPKCPKGSFSVTGLVPCTQCPRYIYTFSKVRSMVTSLRQGISIKQTLHLPRQRTRTLVTSFRQHTLALSHEFPNYISNKQTLNWTTYLTNFLSFFRNYCNDRRGWCANVHALPELPCQATLDQFPFFFSETTTVTWLECERARAALSIGP
jgi:hypothetical protein